MIVVANTRELESRYNLSKIRDDEQVCVQGGMRGKPKYNDERYQRRTTYTGREIKQIINQMKIIENSIPKEWNQFQRAKYIYEVLGKGIEYNYNKEDYKTQRPSSLAGILDRKAICAGYSLLYKEMMDRQGIECDYVRGIGYSPNRNRSEKHAWNVLTINGQSFAVDLTWDSANLRKGETQLQYFGDDHRFFERHEIDPDEKRYQYVSYSKEQINSINTNPNDRQNKGVTQEQQINIVQLAIEQTYLKFEKEFGAAAARTQVEKAIEKYITTGDAISFTRQGDARSQIEQFVSREDMLHLISKSFVENNYNGYNQNTLSRILENSVNETSRVHGMQHTAGALERYIREGNDIGFTRTNNARANLSQYAILPGNAMKLMISTVASRSIEEIEANKTVILDNNKGKTFFYADEFAGAELPAEKKKGIISKAIQWIKEKTKEKLISKTKQDQNVKDDSEER